MGSRPLNRVSKRWPQRQPTGESEPRKEYTICVEPEQSDFVFRRATTTSQTLSILLIDDEPGIRLLLHKGLAAQGYQLYEANDGPTGLAHFHSVQPDLIILDINMPGMDGFTVLKEIRRYDTAVGIIICSAMSIEFMINEAAHRGADSYLVKPIRLQTVLTEVQRIGTLVCQRRYQQI